MTIIYSFLFCGFLCLIGQIILDNSKLTPGHVTSIFACVGAFLSCFGIYQKINTIVGAGANIPIMSFGNALVMGTYEGYLKNGFLGLFDNMLGNVSLGITSVVIFTFFIMIFTKSRD